MKIRTRTRIVISLVVGSIVAFGIPAVSAEPDGHPSAVPDWSYDCVSAPDGLARACAGERTFPASCGSSPGWGGMTGADAYADFVADVHAHGIEACYYDGETGERGRIDGLAVYGGSGALPVAAGVTWVHHEYQDPEGSWSERCRVYYTVSGGPAFVSDFLDCPSVLTPPSPGWGQLLP